MGLSSLRIVLGKDLGKLDRALRKVALKDEVDGIATKIVVGVGGRGRG